MRVAVETRSLQEPAEFIGAVLGWQEVEWTKLTSIGHAPVSQVDDLRLEIVRLEILPDDGATDPLHPVWSDCLKDLSLPMGNLPAAGAVVGLK